MPKFAKSPLKKALFGATLGALGLAVLSSFQSPLSGQDSKPLEKAFEGDQKIAGWGWANQLESDPFRLLALEAAKNPGMHLRFEKDLELRRGQTLMETLLAAGVERRQAYFAIEALSKTFNPRKIRAGQKFRITLEKPAFSGKTRPSLAQIVMPLGFGEEVVVSRAGGRQFSSQKSFKSTRPLRMYAEGVIEDSLYLSALSEGVPLGVISEVIRLFSFDVDFQREIWSGDEFRIFYERRLSAEGEAEAGGKVLAASLILRGKPLTFYRFEDQNGAVEYYTEDGHSAKKMLMKTPVDGARLSSRFGSRKHPVLGYTRMHKGVDFAANTGTPVMAAGDGVVERASRWGSYGNYIRIRHNGTYKTAYAHLSGYARGVRSGARVKQGQIIGYVGATGRVTGAHLHYEIFKDGAQINPLALKLPKGESLKGRALSTHQARIAGFEAETRLIRAFFTPAPNPGEGRTLQTIGD